MATTRQCRHLAFTLLALFLYCDCSGAELALLQGPSFAPEPPLRLAFANGIGGTASCGARGHPQPRVSWHHLDGSSVMDVPGLRIQNANGTLHFPAFSSARYRADVHAAVYRCRAENVIGAVLSRDMRVEAVLESSWQPTVESARALSGGAAALHCELPPATRAHADVLAWYKDDVAVVATPADAGGRYLSGGTRGETLVVRVVGRSDAGEYACLVRHRLSGTRRRSAPAHLLVTEPSGGLSPRLTTRAAEDSVQQGIDLQLACVAVAHPPPRYSWYREMSGQLVAVTTGGRITDTGEVLLIRRSVAGDSGRWVCKAHNEYGEEQQEMIVKVWSPLLVQVNPQFVVANSGSTAVFNCSVSGGSGGDASTSSAHVTWLHDGVRAGAGVGGALVLRGVARAHRGMYQCRAQDTNGDTAQAAAELRLGDTPPELQYTFIEQVLRPGGAVTLRCAASGAPPPRFSWLLDQQPIDHQHLSSHRYSLGQYVTSSGDVVSHLNISVSRADDGGRYTCRADNSVGRAEHSARLNIYGSPSIRALNPIRVVAGANASIFCPYSGYPISSVEWSRDGASVGRSGRLSSRADGELRVSPAQLSDAGAYTCSVSAHSADTGASLLRRDVELVVKNPPKLSPFIFPDDLTEGSSVQVLCGVTSGDRPFYFSWLKDGMPIPPSLQIQEKSLEEFTFLMFSDVRSRHAGLYTCVVSNAAAAVNYSATLNVKVPPSWLVEPQDVSALLGAPASLHCAARGDPQPTLTWFKKIAASSAVVGGAGDAEGEEWEAVVSWRNGSLSLPASARRHEGTYKCRAENGIGAAIAKTVKLAVNEPVHFEESSRSATVRRGEEVTLTCDARGDLPITVHWTKDAASLDLNTYRLSISEMRTDWGVRSALYVRGAERADSASYRCQAENAFGRSELLLRLLVQELPSAPQELRALEVSARGARLTWRRAFDGHAPLLGYRLQRDRVGTRDARRQQDSLDWRDEQPLNVSLDDVHEMDQHSYSALVGGLRPASAYRIRLAAYNRLGLGPFSDPVLINTSEEAPTAAPMAVEVRSTAAGEFLVSWMAPPRESWNGELLGYIVSWRAVDGAAEGAGEGEGEQSRAVRARAVAGLARAELALCGLRTFARYEVALRAFNAVAPGPASTPVVAVTAEGVPEAAPSRVRCEAMTSQSLRVRWDAPPPHLRGGPLQGYDVIYMPTDDQIEWSSSMSGYLGAGLPGWDAEIRHASGTESVLHVLRRATNYSVSVRARSAAGPGVASDPVYCHTMEDVPGPPEDIKAIVVSQESVLVSWIPPLERNGRITHYTVYTRETGRIGRHSSYKVEVVGGVVSAGAEMSREVRGLPEQHLHEFWVTASSAQGEGEPSAIVAQRTSSRGPDPECVEKCTNQGWCNREKICQCPEGYMGQYCKIALRYPQCMNGGSCSAPGVCSCPEGYQGRYCEGATARIASFGRRVAVAGGGSTRLRCLAVGRPAPNTHWSRGRLPLVPDVHYRLLDNGDLIITDVDISLSGNYTCSARNLFGEDAVTLALVVLLPPARPSLRVAHVTRARLQLAWDPPHDGGAPIRGYSLQWARAGEPWNEMKLSADSREQSLAALSCGVAHRAKLRAHNAVGPGARSAVLAVTTKGGRPIPPSPDAVDFITTNTSVARVSLVWWEDGGCAISAFAAEWRALHEAGWAESRAAGGAAVLLAAGLRSGTWYHLRITAVNDAGPTTALYHFATLTDDGERIAAPSKFPPAEADGSDASSGGERYPALLAACAVGGALAAVAVLAAAFVRARACQRTGARKPLPPPPPPPTSQECRDNQRNGQNQQIYTSSPGKRINGKELSDISPYATFSMAGGATGPGAVSTPDSGSVRCGGGGGGGGGVGGVGGGAPVHFRTFGRAEPLDLAASAPARPNLLATRPRTDHHTSECAYGAGVRSRRGARRGARDTDSESSGSPCAECSKLYRTPVRTCPDAEADAELVAAADSSTESPGDASPAPVPGPCPVSRRPRPPRARHLSATSNSSFRF